MDKATRDKLRRFAPPKSTPPLPAVAETCFHSDLDAETHKQFKKRIGTSGRNGFAWKVNDKRVLTYSASANRPGSFKPDNPEDDRSTWSVIFNEYAFKENNRPTSFQKNDHALYAEPKIRLFHQGPRYDLFIVGSTDSSGASKHFLWYIDEEKGKAFLEEKNDKLTLDKFTRCEYILDKGLLWELCEERLVRGQRNRIFEPWVFSKGSFNLWRESTPGPKPPPSNFPPAKTE